MHLSVFIRSGGSTLLTRLHTLKDEAAEQKLMCHELASRGPSISCNQLHVLFASVCD